MLERQKKEIRKLVNDKLAELVPGLQAYVAKEFAEGGTMYLCNDVSLQVVFDVKADDYGPKLEVRECSVHLGVSSPE